MTSHPERAASDRAQGPVVVLAPGKVLRLSAMVDAIVEELHDEPMDSATRDRVRHLYRDALIEVGSTLSDPLLDELAHLQRRGPVSSDDDLRVIVVQLAGWLRGLCDGMAHGDVTIVLRTPEDLSLDDAP